MWQCHCNNYTLCTAGAADTGNLLVHASTCVKKAGELQATPLHNSKKSHPGVVASLLEINVLKKHRRCSVARGTEGDLRNRIAYQLAASKYLHIWYYGDACIMLRISVETAQTAGAAGEDLPRGS